MYNYTDSIANGVTMKRDTDKYYTRSIYFWDILECYYKTRQYFMTRRYIYVSIEQSKLAPEIIKRFKICWYSLCEIRKLKILLYLLSSYIIRAPRNETEYVLVRFAFVCIVFGKDCAYGTWKCQVLCEVLPILRVFVSELRFVLGLCIYSWASCLLPCED